MERDTEREEREERGEIIETERREREKRQRERRETEREMRGREKEERQTERERKDTQRGPIWSHLYFFYAVCTFFIPFLCWNIPGARKGPGLKPGSMGGTTGPLSTPSWQPQKTSMGLLSQVSPALPSS